MKITIYAFAEFHLGELDGQVRKNHKSTLTAFIQSNRLDESADIRDVFLQTFQIARNQYENELAKAGKSDSTILTQRSILNRIRESAERFLKNQGLPTTFHERLRTLIENSGYNVKSLGEEAGIVISSLHGWRRGMHRPSDGHRSAIQRLERILQVPEGTLTDVCYPVAMKRRGTSGVPWGGARTTYAKNVISLQKEPYRLIKKNWPEWVISEWEGIQHFHTAAYLAPEIKRNSQWRIKANGCCGTADVWESHLSCFFGWLLLPENQSAQTVGGGVPLVNLSFAYIADVSKTQSFIEFKRERSKAYNNFTLGFLNLAAQLLRPNTGFLWQHPEIFAPRIGIKPEEWQSKCKHIRANYLQMVRQLKGGYHIKQTRNPEEPIQAILAVQHPVDSLADLLLRMDLDKPSLSRHSSTRAEHARNTLLVAMLSENPLRIGNYAMMTWNTENTGNLYEAGGKWRLRFKPEDFKNERGAARKPYDVGLTDRLNSYIEDYLHTHRPNLRDAHISERVFLNSSVHGRTLDGSMTWSNLSRNIAKLTRRYISDWTPTGFSAHAFRHIIANEYLKNNPNGFQIVADILHDKLETVLKEYGHLNVADGFAHWQRYSDEQNKRYLNCGKTKREEGE